MNALSLLALAAVALSPPPTTVALVADLPDAAARAAVIRRVAPHGDVILLPRGRASVEDLAGALALLAKARQDDGPSPLQRDAVLVLKSSRLTQPLSPRQRLRLEAHLARLLAANPRPVEGVGTVPAIDVNVRARARPR